jgi:hypothetical protein
MKYPYNELYPTCFRACLFVPCMVNNYATNFPCFPKKKKIWHVLLSHIDFERKASKERLSIPTSSIDFDFEQQK